MKKSVPEMLYPSLRLFFEEYAAIHLTDDEDLCRNALLKRDHTWRVCALAEKIAGSLKMNAGETALALLSSLLHDIGRFEQYASYRTFSDLHSENHALVGLRIIEKHELISPLSEADRELVLSAVEHHNAQALPVGLDERTLRHARLIRDADKLDILPLMINYSETRHLAKNPGMEGKLPDTPGFSPEIIDVILCCGTVSNAMRKNQNDMRLVQLAWLLDLNFPWSYSYAFEQKFAQRMCSFLPDDPMIDRVYEHVARTVAAGMR
jgi:putative nucleotidyltransferase with HDIG domain